MLKKLLDNVFGDGAKNIKGNLINKKFSFRDFYLKRGFLLSSY